MSEKVTPSTSMIIQTDRNLVLRKSSSHPNIPLAAKAAASGAVIAEVMPAANSPIPMRYLADDDGHAHESACDDTDVYIFSYCC